MPDHLYLRKVVLIVNTSESVNMGLVQYSHGNITAEFVEVAWKLGPLIFGNGVSFTSHFSFIILVLSPNHVHMTQYITSCMVVPTIYQRRHKFEQASLNIYAETALHHVILSSY